MLEVGVSAATDITGFGLLGHLRNVTRASGCSATLWMDAMPVIDAAVTYAGQGIVPGGTHANRRFLTESVAFEPGVGEVSQLLLCDAQTSGGLLLAVSPGRAQALVSALTSRGTPCARIIGQLDAGQAGTTRVLPARRPADSVSGRWHPNSRHPAHRNDLFACNGCGSSNPPPPPGVPGAPGSAGGPVGGRP